MDKIGLETSQHVVINYEPADVFQRILAWFVDALVLSAYALVLSLIWEGLVPNNSVIQNEYGWILFLLYTLPTFLYPLILETAWKGYTVGKKFLGIRVVMIDGSRPQIGSFIVRWLFRLLEVTAMAGSLAIITILLNGKGQRLGDIVAKTTVVKDKKRTKLSDTIFTDLEDKGESNLQGHLDLTDKEINIIKEVLSSRKTYDYNTWFVLLTKTRKAIETKTGIENPDMKNDEYLQAIIEDYNRQFSD